MAGSGQVVEDGARAPARPSRPPDRFARQERATGLAVLAGVVALGLAALARLEPLPADGLSLDVGIQFHLASEAARGAVPVRDFEHGWNVLGWYYLALFYVLSFGQATLWSFLWGTVAGRLLAGVLLLLLARRHGLSAGWLLGLTAVLLLVSDIPNGKYALPAVWLVLLRPGGRLGSGRAAVVARFLLAGVLVLGHIELALMLCLGTALYDLVGARALAWRERWLRVAALAAGGLLLFAAEVAAYAALGVAPAELVRFLILDRAGVSAASTAYDASLLQPANLLGAVFPASLVVAFVPAVWRRLSDTTRLTACLHLSLGLVAIRKPDEGHLGAATGLLAALVVLAAWDLVQSGARVPRRPRLSGAAVAPAVGGAAWLLAAVLAGFSAGSILALPVLLGITALGAVVARWRELPWASAGALAAAVGLTLVSAGSMALAEVRGPRDELLERTMAEALAPAVESCLDGGREAWVVPEPLRLYATLDLDNPTPYYLFWDGFADEAPRVLERIEAGEVPAVLQQGPWPRSMAEVGPVIEDRYALCEEVLTPAVPEDGVGARTVRIWVDPRR